MEVATQCQPFLRHDTAAWPTFFTKYGQFTQGNLIPIRKICETFYECRGTNVSTSALSTHWLRRNKRENISASCAIQLSWNVRSTWKGAIKEKRKWPRDCGKKRCAPQHLPWGYKGNRITSFRRRSPRPRLKPRYLHHFGVAHATNNPSP